MPGWAGKLRVFARGARRHWAEKESGKCPWPQRHSPSVHLTWQKLAFILFVGWLLPCKIVFSFLWQASYVSLPSRQPTHSFGGGYFCAQFACWKLHASVWAVQMERKTKKSSSLPWWWEWRIKVVVSAATGHLVVWGEESREGLGAQVLAKMCSLSSACSYQAFGGVGRGEQGRAGAQVLAKVCSLRRTCSYQAFGGGRGEQGRVGGPRSWPRCAPSTAFGLGLTIFLCTWFCPQK